MIPTHLRKISCISRRSMSFKEQVLSQTERKINGIQFIDARHTLFDFWNVEQCGFKILKMRSIQKEIKI